MPAYPGRFKYLLRQRRQIFVAVLICCIMALYGCEQKKSQVREWRFALEEIQGGVQDAYAQKFKQLIEAKTNGKTHVSIYPYGTLGTSDQITELVNNGAVHFAMASPGHLGKLIPEVQVFLLHFLFSDNDEVDKQVYAHLQDIQAFHSLYAQKGLELLSFYPEGWMVWTTRQNIEHPEDFQGVKFRVMTSPLLLASYAAYGASPISMPYSEVYSGLQLKMIDGQVNPIFAIEEMSFYEVTQHMIFPRHAQFITSAIASKRFFDKLSPDDQKMIRETIAELNGYIYDVQEQYNRERLERIRKRSKIDITTLTPAERQEFRQRYEPVYDTFRQMVGPKGAEILKTIQTMVKTEEAKQSSADAKSTSDAKHASPQFQTPKSQT